VGFFTFYHMVCTLIATGMKLDWVDAMIALTISDNNRLSKINFHVGRERRPNAFAALG
jgi:hypothetical protein